MTPDALVQRAHAHGVHTLALTDHDTLAGTESAALTGQSLGMTVLPAVEISTTWQNRTVHLVGLWVDKQHPALASGLAAIRAGREARARKMAESLAASGIPGALEGAYRHAGNREMIGRTHFARFLFESGHASSVANVFNRFLKPGKPGYVKHQWADFAEAVAWVHAAGGQAVLAHPGRYDIGSTLRRKLLSEFRDLGGEALEVSSGSHHHSMLGTWADFAREYGFMASAGSDFHAPGEGGRELGRLLPLPDRCKPIWKSW